MSMKKDQRGFTIVEVLIASAILSIVVLTVCAFIVVGSKSYAAGNSDINVQQEAQLALNQMSDVVIDTTRSVNYIGYDAGGTTSEKALKDAEFTFTPEDKSFVMYNGVLVEDPAGGPDPIVEAGNGNKHYHFYWNKKAETLYYAELDVQATDADTSAISFPAPPAGDLDPTAPPPAGWVKLASHVTDFSVDLSQVEEKRVVQLALTFVDGRKEYTTSNNVTIRNKVGVNDAELAAINKKKTLQIIPRDNPIIEPGEIYHFSTPKVIGDNVTDRSVTWSVETQHSRSGGTKFTDAANGILQVATDEPSGKVIVKIETNAVDSEGNHATKNVEVNIKRVTTVALAKTADDNADNGPNEVSPGCTFTISTNVSGNKVGETCSVCGEDTAIDTQVSYENNPFGCGYVWRVYNPSANGGTYDPTQYVEIVESKADHATFRIKSEKDGAPVSDGNVTHEFVIQAVSLLSLHDNAQGRHYDGVPGIETGWVPGAIKLKVVKSKESAEPYGGKLKYGEQTLDESIRKGLPTDYNKYLTAIRVVDNTGKMPDRVLLHYTIGGGNNYRICPDLFDLDLNGSYTFYMQAIFPIPEERYEEGKGGTADDNETIKNEYFSHLDTGKPYGYVGTRYRHGKVFYAKLDRPKITIRYQGVEYKGRNITCDPVNPYQTQRLIEKIEPCAYENVEGNAGMNGMVYSLYEGDGNVQSQWKKLYCYDGDTMSYQGSTSIGNGAGQYNPGGDPCMQLNDFSRREAVCGKYHIVPGMLYQNKAYDYYEIVGWQGFDYPNLPRKVRYYEFDESTVHARITSEFTMYINHERFKGKVLFPLPEEMEASAKFPNMNSMDWQTSAGLTLPALRDGQSNIENITFTYVKYRYISADKAWEVEPRVEEFRTEENKIRTYSYGIYKSRKGDKEWTFVRSGATTDRAFAYNLEGFMIEGKAYKMYFPLPSEESFPFGSGLRKMDCNSSHVAYDDAGNQTQWLQNNARIKYELTGDVHRIIFINKHYEPQEFGVYEWETGDAAWTKVK